MNRRDLFRSTLLGALGAASAAKPGFSRDLPSGYDASKELERPDWKPVFIDEHQNQTLIALSDLIIPATDTPGAKDALVNRFLDLLMSAEIPETQRAFLSALAYLDGAAMERHNAAFIYIHREQQTALLYLLAYPHSHRTWGEPAEEFAGNHHFGQLKTWITGAYYSSPIGLKELGWDGSPPHGVFTGCAHEGTTATATDGPTHGQHQ